MSIHLNPAQKDAVVSDENLLCIACPGSGKTRVLVEKVKHVMALRKDATIILTTFSRDAAAEIRDRLARSLNSEIMSRLIVGTFHSLAMRQLRAADAVGHILSQIETRHIILRALEATGASFQLDEAEQIIATCKTDPDYAERHWEAAKLTSGYQDELRMRDASDFIDLIIRANAMMAAGQIRPLVATHFFIDEFQDIDRLQFEWLRHHLVEDRIVCAVGDDDQSVYGFRKSLGYRGMMEFVAMSAARVITLDTNYRSVDPVLEYSGRLISHNLDRVRKQVKGVRGDGMAPQLIQTALPDDQIEHLLGVLSELCLNNPVPQPLPDRKPYRFGVRKGQAAILARTNRQLSAVEKLFIDKRVPYSRTGRTLWEQAIPQVFASLLQSLHARNSVGIEVALRWARVPDSLIQTLGSAGGGDLWSLLDPARPDPGRIQGGPPVETLIKSCRDLARKMEGEYSNSTAEGVIYGVAAWMDSVLCGTCGENDPEVLAAARLKAEDEGKELWMVGTVKDVLAGFNGNLSRRVNLARMDAGHKIPRVVLSTFHAAKGLEWESVFLIGVVTGVVPKVKDTAEDAEIEEERRLLYVAMTRARDHLYLYTHRNRGARPSEFLADAGLYCNEAKERSEAAVAA